MKINSLAVVLLMAASLFGVKNAEAQFKLTFYRAYDPNPIVEFCQGCESSYIGQYATYNTVYNTRDYPFYKAQHVGTLNDVFSSVLINAQAGDTITILNNADADYSDGSCIIYVKQTMSGYYLDSFERTYEDAYIKVQWWSEQQKLNGKVSCFVVTH